VVTALALEKFEEAVPWVLRRVELAQSVTELETAIGQATMVFDRADKTEEIAEKLKAQTPRSVLLTCLLAELWEQTGNSEQADAVLQDSAEAGKLLAISQQIRLFTSRRDWQKAADATRRILELPGGQKSLHVRRLVELYTRDYQLDEALKWIQTWRQLSPGSTSPWLAEARLLRLQGKESDAVNVLRKASQRFDTDENLRAKLATTYTELGKLGDAERIYWRSVSIGKSTNSAKTSRASCNGSSSWLDSASSREKRLNWSRILKHAAATIVARLCRCSRWQKSIVWPTTMKGAGRR